MDDTQNNLPEGEEQQKVNEGQGHEESQEASPAPGVDVSKEVAEESAPEMLAEVEETPLNEVVETPETTTAVEEGATVEEAVLSDDELEKDDDTAEIQADEDHDEERPEQLEMPDYADFKPDDLIAAGVKLLQDQPIQILKDHFSDIRKYLISALNEERKGKLDEFIEQGGNELDFEFIQPLREQFRSVFQEYRRRRRTYFDDLSTKLEQNLQSKRAIIERLKELVTKEESISDTFKEFRGIQDEWRVIGSVPRNESRDLWRTYHFHVENFYEFVKINKELRDLDFKKNKTQKDLLIVKAQKIADTNNLKEGFKELQKLHREWRQIGPVEPEFREVLWNTFSGITKQIHERREEFYKDLKLKREVLLADKRKLVQDLKDLPREFKKHHEWQEAIKGINVIQDQFRKIGRLPMAENDIVWEEFRGALRDFNQSKNQFYKDLKKEHSDNLEKKKVLLAKADELKDSDDWRGTSNEYKRIQSEWKKIGHVPKSESDKIWKEFRAACNHFFGRLTENQKGRDQAFDVNAENKKVFLQELEALNLDPSDKKAAIGLIKTKIGEWKSLGPVPGKMRNEFDNRFNKAIDGFFKAIDLDRLESQRIRFENKLDSLAEQGEQGLLRERDYLRSKLDESKKELMQLENNMSFFKSSDPNSPVVKNAQKNIDVQKNGVASIQGQVKMITERVKTMRAAEEAEEAAKASATEASKDNA